MISSSKLLILIHILISPCFAKPSPPALEADFLKWAEFGARLISHMDTRSDMYRELGLKLCQMDKKEEALKALESAIQALKDKKDSIGTTWPLLYKIVTVYTKIGEFEKAMKLTTKILEPGNQAKSEIAIIKALHKKSRLQDRDIMARVRSAKSKIARMQILQEGMENTYRRMAQDFIPKIRDRRARALALEKCIQDLLKSGENNEVQAVFAKLKALEEKTQYPPDKVFLLLAISRTSGRINGRRERAIRNRALKIIAGLKDPVQRVRLYLQALEDSYISREDSLKELKRLEQVCTKIPYEDIRSVVLGELSRKYTVLDDEVGAFGVVAQIWQIRETVKQTILHDLIALRTVEILIELNRVEDATRWATMIRNPNRQDKARQKIAPEHAQADNLRKALEVAATIKKTAYGLAALTHSAIHMADHSPSKVEARKLKEAILKRTGGN